MAKGLNLAGVFPPIPTPFDGSGELALDKLAANLNRWNDWPLGGYVVGGSNGEFVLLEDPERVAVVEAARQNIPDGRLLIAGSGAQSTRRTLALTESMATVGVDAVIVVTPSYYRRQMDARAMVSHFVDVAEASPVPVILYNVPANTGLGLPLAAVVELADHPNIIGMKDSGGDVVRLATIVQRTDPEFQVLAGSASFFLAALSVGAVGAVSALANLAGVKLVELQSAFERGERSRAADLQGSMLAVNHAVTAGYGVPGLKAAMDMLGFYGGPVRGPLLDLGEAERQDLKGILADAGLV